MTRPSLGRAGLLTVVLAGAPIAAGAQTTEGILAPGGHLRFEAASTFHLWDDRFGLREEGTALVEEREPLAYDLERVQLLDLADLQTRLRGVIGSPVLDLTLGTTAARISRERTEVMLGAAVGVFDWLTIGVNVPLVQTRTEISFDFRGTDLGRTPTTTGTFRSTLTSSAAQIESRRAQECPGGPDCAALSDLAARYGSFARDLALAYAEDFFLATGSAAAAGLEARLSAFRTEAGQRAPGVAMPGPAPLAEPLTETELVELLTAESGLLQPVQTYMAPYKLGDVEVTGALRLLEGAVRDSASAPARFRYLFGVQGLVRLPTGTQEHPDLPLDVAGSDRQLDVELGGFADLRWRRVGIQAVARRGVQQATTVIRRVARPEDVFPGVETRRSVRWTPGSYFAVEVAPRWHLTDELALGALYRGFRKDADEYEEVGAVDPALAPADVLERETQATLGEVGLGLAYSTVNTWREGRARLPLDLSLAVRKAVTGSGGATPAGWRMEASGKAFVRLWGARPQD